VLQKKSPAVCGGRALKAKFKNTPAPYGAIAFELQTLEFQTAHLARRFGLSPHAAAAIASLAWGAAR
jgi:hypothetical protein